MHTPVRMNRPTIQGSWFLGKLAKRTGAAARELTIPIGECDVQDTAGTRALGLYVTRDTALPLRVFVQQVALEEVDGQKMRPVLVLFESSASMTGLDGRRGRGKLEHAGTVLVFVKHQVDATDKDVRVLPRSTPRA